MVVDPKEKPIRLGLERAAKQLGVSMEVLRKQARNGNIEYFQFGVMSGMRFDPAHLEAFKAKVRLNPRSYPDIGNPSWLTATAA